VIRWLLVVVGVTVAILLCIAAVVFLALFVYWFVILPLAAVFSM